MGNPVGQIEKAWVLSYVLANASFYEEIVVRVLLIGLPLAIFYLIRDKRVDLPRMLFGRFERLDTAFWVLAIISSIMFGVAHVGAWTWYKAIPTAVSGIAFAWLYGKYGLPAAVLLHYTFDYIFMPLLLFFEFGNDSVYITLMLTGIYFLFIAGAFFVGVATVFRLIFKAFEPDSRKKDLDDPS